jgi:hypothetical protein
MTAYDQMFLELALGQHKTVSSKHSAHLRLTRFRRSTLKSN